ncbi:MAG: hypothetical protein ACPL2D_10615 [Ignavibacteria bacterium]
MIKHIIGHIKSLLMAFYMPFLKFKGMDMEKISPYAFPGIIIKIDRPEKLFNLIYELVIKEYNIDPKLIFQKTRQRSVLEYKQVVDYFLVSIVRKNMPNMQGWLTRIQSIYGRDRCTMLNSYKVVNNLMDAYGDKWVHTHKIKNIWQKLNTMFYEEGSLIGYASTGVN